MLNNEMNKDDLSLQQIYQEMALSNLQKIGKWGDKKNRHGYDKASIGILSSPAGLKKLEYSFNRIGNWDFNLYFVKKPGAWKEAEKGLVTPEYIKNVTTRCPDLQVFALRLDRGLSSSNVLNEVPGKCWNQEIGLNDHQYIIPGAGGLGEILNNSYC
jgi:hypothetical protein